MRAFSLCLLLFCPLLTACSDQALKSTEPEDNGFDSADTGCPPNVPGCVDTGDTALPADSDTSVEPNDCEVLGSSAHSVDILEECTGTGSGGTVEDPYNLTRQSRNQTGRCPDPPRAGGPWTPACLPPLSAG